MESKMHLERAWRASKRHKRRPRDVQEVSKWRLVAPSGVLEASKRLQQTPKSAQVVPKTPPRDSKLGAKGIQDALEEHLKGI